MVVAIIGCGSVVKSVYVSTLTTAGVRTRFVHDLDDASAREVAGALRAEATSLETIQAQADVVLIATPPSTHADLIRTFLKPRRVVFCEKPLVGSRAEAIELCDEARTRECRLYVGHFRRTFPAVRLVRSLVATGALGRVRSLDVAEGGRFAWNAASGYTTRDPLGGVLYDTGSHAVDLALFAAGLDTIPLKFTRGEVRRDRPEPAHEIEAVGSLEGPNHSLGFSLRLSRLELRANRILVTCEHSSIAFSVGPAFRVRIWGPAGSTPLNVSSTDDGYDQFFVRQWQDLVGGTADYLEAQRIVAVTGVLEDIAAQDGNVLP